MQESERAIPPFLLTLYEKKKWILGLFASLCVAMLGFSLLKQYQIEGYQQLLSLCQEKEKEQNLDELTLKRLASAFQYPELKQRYEPIYTQKCLETHQITWAENWGKEPLAHLAKEAPIHAKFSAISLLIAKQEYQTSLEKSLELKQQLSSQKEKAPFLYGFNLYRIASLYKKLDLLEEEKTAWKEAKESMDLLPKESPLVQALFPPNSPWKAFLEKKGKAL